MSVTDTLISKYVIIPNRCDYSCKGNIRLLKSRSGEYIATSVVGDLKGKTVIYCHGNGENAISSNFLWKKLARFGITVVTPDYEGCGMSSGICTEHGCYDAAHAAYDWLRTYTRKSPSDIIVLGYSLGSGVALELASSENVGGLILQAPFYSGSAMIDFYKENRISGIESLLSSAASPFISSVFPSDAFAHKTRCRTLVFHGTADATVPYSQGKALFDKIASKRKDLVTVSGGGHCTFQSKIGTKRYVRMLADFIYGNSLSANNKTR